MVSGHSKPSVWSVTCNSILDGVQIARISTCRSRAPGGALWIALLHGSARASSQAEFSSWRIPCSSRKQRISRRTELTFPKSHSREVRKVTHTGAWLARCDISIALDNLENPVEPG